MATNANGAPAPTIDTSDLAQLEAGRRLVVQYLNEALATENALVTTLTTHISITPKGTYRTVLERHRTETREQSAAIQKRLGELGAGASPLAAATGVLQSAIGQVLSLSKGPIDLLRGKGGEEKLLKNAKDECATEALEIATYDALITLARAVGDEKTAKLAERHLRQEERMLDDLRDLIPSLTQATVLALAGGKPTYDVETTGAADAVRGVRRRAGEAVEEAGEAVAGRKPAGTRRTTANARG